MIWYSRDENGVETPLTVSGGQTIQVNEMPAASADYVGIVCQYIGATTANYTHNYFYECVEDISTNPTTYSWVGAKVQNDEGDTFRYSIMPTASADWVGKIVQYTGEDASGLGYDLINGHWYKCESWGTGYIWTDLYTDSINNSSKPVVSSAVNSALQTKQNIIQVAEMPTASSTRAGDILQYIGTTTTQYTKGYFYQCMPSGNLNNYRWSKIDVVGISSKENVIIQTPSVTLTVAGWTNNQQTVGTGGVAILDNNRNIIDIPYEDIQTWADCGIMLIGHASYGTSDEQYIDSLTFRCNTVPNAALTFKVTSMEVN